MWRSSCNKHRSNNNWSRWQIHRTVTRHCSVMLNWLVYFFSIFFSKLLATSLWFRFPFNPQKLYFGSYFAGWQEKRRCSKTYESCSTESCAGRHITVQSQSETDSKDKAKTDTIISKRKGMDAAFHARSSTKQFQLHDIVKLLNLSAELFSPFASKMFCWSA